MLTSALRVFLTRSFKPFVFKGSNEKPLDFISLENFGLYVHIPFCKSICSFCPYNKELFDESKAKRYKQALLTEIDLVCKGMTSKKAVTSLYFGGGTPALMAESIGEIIEKLKQYFIINEGIGVELHPDNITPAILRELKNAGVTMVSLGFQSFDRECLSKIGRKYGNFEEKLLLVQNFGFSVIDVDLIFAMPGQTNEILYNDLKTAFDNGATQVSTYPFIDFTFAKNDYKPQSKKAKKEMLKFLSDSAKKLDLCRTSVWTFAKAGTVKYSSVTRDNFLGFGPSATTLLKDCFKINTFSVDEYIKTVSNEKIPTALTLDFTQRQRAVYYMFWAAYGLKLNDGSFKRITGRNLRAMFGAELWLSQKFGFIRSEDNGYRLTDKAAMIYHKLEQAYTTAYIDKMWNIARLEPFPRKIVLR